MVRLRRRLSSLPKLAGSASSKNGFVLADALCAVTIGLLLFIPSLLLMQYTVRQYEQAGRIHTAIFLARQELARREMGQGKDGPERFAGDDTYQLTVTYDRWRAGWFMEQVEVEKDGLVLCRFSRLQKQEFP